MLMPMLKNSAWQEAQDRCLKGYIVANAADERLMGCQVEYYLDAGFSLVGMDASGDLLFRDKLTNR